MKAIGRFLLGIDRFLIMLVATVAAASIIPVRGSWAEVMGVVADVAVALLFFLHGAKLSTQAVLAGVGKWKLHLCVLGSSFILFPLIGLALSASLSGVVSAQVLAGLLYLSLLPSTVQSSIAFTAMAGGDVPAAVCSASLSNILGVFITPLLVTLTLHAGGVGAAPPSAAVGSIVLQILAPFLAGHLLRPVIGGFIDRHKKVLMPIDRTSILLVVYTAFSAAVLEGIWRRTGAGDLVIILGLAALMLSLVMGVNLALARVLRLATEDEIVLLFCGSKKSLVSGVPMAGALFPAAQVGVMILPLMIFHQLQLFVCSVIASHYRRRLVEAAA